MSTKNVFPEGWEQQAILPPAVIEVRMVIGVIPSADHAQLQVEALNPVTKELLALQSMPHLGLGVLPERALQFHEMQIDYALKFIEESDPFP